MLKTVEDGKVSGDVMGVVAFEPNCSPLILLGFVQNRELRGTCICVRATSLYIPISRPLT